jgi:hypothetical protein
MGNNICGNIGGDSTYITWSRLPSNIDILGDYNTRADFNYPPNSEDDNAVGL